MHNMRVTLRRLPKGFHLYLRVTGCQYIKPGGTQTTLCGLEAELQTFYARYVIGAFQFVSNIKGRP